MTIPGLGAITALALVAVIGDVTRFPSPRQLVGYLGWTRGCASPASGWPVTGTSPGPGRAHARGLLIEAAHTAIRTPAVARVPRSPGRPAHQADRAVRHGAQARRPGLAPADQGRGLPLRRGDDHRAQAPAPGRRPG